MGFDAIQGAYYILRQVKTKVPKAKGMLSKQLMSDLARDVSKETKEAINKDFNMGVTNEKDNVRGYRDTILALNDAFQLIAIWDWLDRLTLGEDLDVYGRDITYLGKTIKEMVKRIEEEPKVTLNQKRDIKHSISATYIALAPRILRHFGEGTTKAYQIRVNMLLKYYLGIEPLFTLEED